jgi:hypothetical protein
MDWSSVAGTAGASELRHQAREGLDGRVNLVDLWPLN